MMVGRLCALSCRGEVSFVKQDDVLSSLRSGMSGFEICRTRAYYFRSAVLAFALLLLAASLAETRETKCGESAAPTGAGVVGRCRAVSRAENEIRSILVSPHALPVRDRRRLVLLEVGVLGLV